MPPLLEKTSHQISNPAKLQSAQIRVHRHLNHFFTQNSQYLLLLAQYFWQFQLSSRTGHVFSLLCCFLLAVSFESFLEISSFLIVSVLVYWSYVIQHCNLSKSDRCTREIILSDSGWYMTIIPLDIYNMYRYLSRGKFPQLPRCWLHLSFCGYWLSQVGATTDVVTGLMLDHLQSTPDTKISRTTWGQLLSLWGTSTHHKRSIPQPSPTHSGWRHLRKTSRDPSEVTTAALWFCTG